MAPAASKPRRCCVLAGNVGQGKTSLFNYLTGRNEPTGAGGRPVTTNCTTAAIIGFPDCFVIDALGFGDGGHTDQEIRSAIVREVGHTPGLLVNLVAVVVRFAQARECARTNELLNRFREANLAVKFIVLNDAARDWVRAFYSEYGVVQLAWDQGYAFDRRVLVDQFEEPGVNLRANPKTCKHCALQFFEEDEEKCVVHVLQSRHPPQMHTMALQVIATTTRHYETHKHTQPWGGITQGYKCCGRGKGCFSWHHDDCPNSTQLVAYEEPTEALACTHCGSFQGGPGCPRPCPCGTAGCLVECTNPACRAAGKAGEVTHATGCMPKADRHCAK